MTGELPRSRRNFVRTTAAVAIGGTLLAGCSGSDGGQSPTDDAGTDGATGEPATDSTAGESSGGSDLDAWFEGVDNYSGVVDETGSDSVTVTVGAQGNGGGYAFDPPAVEISTGTTVVWEWTGEGGAHNVAAEDGSFESEMTDEKGYTFEHTFDAAGTYTYVCVPHETMGMKGAVVVE
ncbi:halocyanin domain-containing protein [Halegenticoccus soli]|uniref:halocyanin domain-containing protein n=1 Tax=Halegenticoccus soli TaxID=1985678 RepID=UPI000C6CBF49|nr:halocyanin domain-containing protein [Halegenticoccus soli]